MDRILKEHEALVMVDNTHILISRSYYKNILSYGGADKHVYVKYFCVYRFLCLNAFLTLKLAFESAKEMNTINAKLQMGLLTKNFLVLAINKSF